jgi:hypothetical protein
MCYFFGGIYIRPVNVYLLMFFIVYSFIHMSIHCLDPLSPPPPHLPHFQIEPVLPSSPILLKRRHKWFIRKTAFLLVWDKDSYKRIPNIASMHMCITICIGSSLPDLFTISQSPSHSGLCQFKITLSAPLQWAHQTLSSFEYPTFPYSSWIHSPLNLWPISNNITAFVWGIKTTYEGEHMSFGFLSLVNFA